MNNILNYAFNYIKAKVYVIKSHLEFVVLVMEKNWGKYFYYFRYIYLIIYLIV